MITEVNDEAEAAIEQASHGVLDATDNNWDPNLTSTVCEESPAKLCTADKRGPAFDAKLGNIMSVLVTDTLQRTELTRILIYNPEQRLATA